MEIEIKRSASLKKNQAVLFVLQSADDLKQIKELSADEAKYVSSSPVFLENKILPLNGPGKNYYFWLLQQKKKATHTLELVRGAGYGFSQIIESFRITSAAISGTAPAEFLLAAAEGTALSSYRFTKYSSTPDKKASSLKEITITGYVPEKEIGLLNVKVKGTCIARDLVNEPVCYLTAVRLSKEIQKLGKDAGFTVEVLTEAKILSLKMGGLIAVNLGAEEPPTFTIMEYKPAKAKNRKPLVLVGKGVVFDTGGVNIKTAGMDTMKCDMAGAAAVAGAIYAIAKAGFPYHVVGLIPATENRPGGNAYVPGDVVTMFDGTKVEVLNTDAEGRIILGDALAYAKKYKPELVIDLATLTGAAERAIGTAGIAAMTNTEDEIRELEQVGEEVYERLAILPMWDEYKDMIRSDVADIKNLGGPLAGAQTAGKFLEHFTDYPWIHLDIAGPAFLDHGEKYRVKGATGSGVRLLFEFVRKRCNA